MANGIGAKVKNTFKRLAILPILLIPSSIDIQNFSRQQPIPKVAQETTQTQEEELEQQIDPEKRNLTFLSDYLRNKGHAIDTLISDSRFEIYPDIVRYFTGSAERRIKSLDEYKKILGFEDKKTKLSAFIENNRTILEKAEETYDIPKETIASIIGIESGFGAGIGRFNPFNAYVSMYVKGHRQDFARGQLEELLAFSKKRKLNVLEMKSSYAGAISYAQFIPSSLNRWFVGSNLYGMDDNILSVGNYLSHFK